MFRSLFNRIFESFVARSVYMRQVTFCTTAYDCFGKEYSREPTREALVRIEREFVRAGFPGCIGYLYCAGWSWKNLPKVLQGIMIGKDGKQTVRMEAICSMELWVWSF